MKKKEELDNKKLNPYQSDKLAKIPSWIKILLLKYWVVAATFFFFGIANPLVSVKSDASYDMYYLWISLGLALFTEYILKQIVRLMRTSRCDTYKYNLINIKGVGSLLLNLVYSFAIMIPMVLILGTLAKHNLVLPTLGDGSSAIEPFTAGFVYIILDFIVLFIKNVSINIYKKSRYGMESRKINKEIKKTENNKE